MSKGNFSKENESYLCHKLNIFLVSFDIYFLYRKMAVKARNYSLLTCLTESLEICKTFTGSINRVFLSAVSVNTSNLYILKKQLF